MTCRLVGPCVRQVDPGTGTPVRLSQVDSTTSTRFDEEGLKAQTEMRTYPAGCLYSNVVIRKSRPRPHRGIEK